MGKPTSVSIRNVEYATKRGTTSARHAGLRFERKVHEDFRRRFENYFMEPIIRFIDNSGIRYCRPDGVLELSDRLVVFEIKSQHMPEAWWQLRKLYQPVIEAWRPELGVQVVEVVKSYDQQMPFPEPVVLMYSDEMNDLLRSDTDKFGVYLWKQ